MLEFCKDTETQQKGMLKSACEGRMICTGHFKWTGTPIVNYAHSRKNPRNRVHRDLIMMGHLCQSTTIYPKSNRTGLTANRRFLNDWWCMAGRLKGTERFLKLDH